MSIKEGFACFACDRPAKAHKDGKAPEVYLQEGESARGEWIDTAYTDEHGAEQRITLCPECAEAYRELRRKRAAELSRFARGW